MKHGPEYHKASIQHQITTLIKLNSKFIADSIQLTTGL